MMDQSEKDRVFSTIDYLVSMQVSNQIPIHKAEQAWNSLLTNVPREVVAEGLSSALISLPSPIDTANKTSSLN